MTIRKMLGVIAVAASGVLAAVGFIRHKNENATPPAERTYQHWLQQSWNHMARDMNLSRDDSLAIIDIADIRFAYQRYQSIMMARDSFPARARSRAELDSVENAATRKLSWDPNILNMKYRDNETGQVVDNPRIDFVINVHSASLGLLAAGKSRGDIGVPPRPFGMMAQDSTLSGRYFYHVRQDGLDNLARAFNKSAATLRIPQYSTFYLSSLLMGGAMTQEIKTPPPFDAVLPTVYDVRLGPDFLLKPLDVSQMVIGHEVAHIHIMHQPQLREKYMHYTAKNAVELACDSIGMYFADNKNIALAGFMDGIYGAHQTASRNLTDETRLAELRHNILMWHYIQRDWDADDYPKNIERYQKLRDDYGLMRDDIQKSLRIPNDPRPQSKGFKWPWM